MLSPPHRRMLPVVLGLLLTACGGLGTTASTPPPSPTGTPIAATQARGQPSASPSPPSIPLTPTAAVAPAGRSAMPSPQGTVPASPRRASASPPGLGTAPLTPRGPGVPLTPPPTVGADTWERLRRPLQLPALAAGSPCPARQGRIVAPAYGYALGAGPVYAVGLGETGVLRINTRQEGGWFYQKMLFTIGPEYRGPVLIRGRQLDGPNELRFGVGPEPATELPLPLAGSGADWRNFPSSVRLRAPGCYAWQVDGEDFSAVIIFEAVQ